MCGYKNGYEIDMMNLEEIGLHVQNMLIMIIGATHMSTT